MTTGAPAKFAILLIRLYQLAVAPLLPPACRFYPSCSHYAIGAYRQHGAIMGTWLSARRLAKCHPFHPGGLDPVPERRATDPVPRSR